MLFILNWYIPNNSNHFLTNKCILLTIFSPWCLKNFTLVDQYNSISASYGKRTFGRIQILYLKPYKNVEFFEFVLGGILQLMMAIGIYLKVVCKSYSSFVSDSSWVCYLNGLKWYFRSYNIFEVLILVFSNFVWL